MYFKQFYLGCLAHASYMIGAGGVAAVVDPRRDVDIYLEEADREGLRIEHVIETHLHADFVSGHCELARRSGARIYIGHAAEAAFDHVSVRDGDEISFGGVTLRFLETPGHTPEGISVLVVDGSEPDAPRMLLTGDTLFVGDVGRPDLAAGRGFTAEQMAGMLYDTLRSKILPLPDSVLVYPAHGAGSACGRNISTETFSTIGEQRRSNYALQEMPREHFVRLVTDDLGAAPKYFSFDAEVNRRGAPALAELPRPRPLGADDVAALAASGATLLDVRPNVEYGAGHLPGSVNIGLGGQFASWAGTLLDQEDEIVLVASGGEEVAEAVTRLARVGFERVVGYLDGGVEAWSLAGREVASVPQIVVGDLRDMMSGGEWSDLQVVDVRRPGEYASGHVPGATSLPLDRVASGPGPLDPARPTAVICAGGYRSSAATSLLEAMGFARLFNVLGGTGAWVQAGYPVEPAADRGRE